MAIGSRTQYFMESRNHTHEKNKQSTWHRETGFTQVISKSLSQINRYSWTKIVEHELSLKKLHLSKDKNRKTN